MIILLVPSILIGYFCIQCLSTNIPSYSLQNDNDAMIARLSVGKTMILVTGSYSGLGYDTVNMILVVKAILRTKHVDDTTTTTTTSTTTTTIRMMACRNI
jgi:hypothetical protein